MRPDPGNWDYSEFERSELCGKRWFCLSAVSVGRISDPVADSDILLPIEPMFLDILAKVRGGLAPAILRMPAEDQQKVFIALQAMKGNR